MSNDSGILLDLGILAGWLGLTLLPGAWITFGLPLPNYSFWTRLLTGMALAPFVIFVQFFVLRAFGVPFQTTAYVLPVINLAAVYLIYRRRGEFTVPKAQVFLSAIIVFLIPVSLLVPQLLNSEVRIFTGHSWMQSDVIYMLADGNLRLEEPEMAGLVMDYPWAAHPFQAVLSYLLNSPPASSYIWTNLIFLACSFGFSAYTVAELGGNRFSRITSFLWLCFGLNFIGEVFFNMLPAALSGTFWDHVPWRYAWIGGDYRVTPWMLKFFFFEQSIAGAAMLGGLIYLVIRERSVGFRWDSLILLGTLLCGIGLVYPVYFAPAAIIIFAAAATFYLGKGTPGAPDYVRQCGSLAIVVFISAIVTYVYVKFLTVDRVTQSITLPSPTMHFAKYGLVKTAATATVLSLFLVGLAFAFRRCWRTNRDATLMLLGGGFGSALMYILLEIPGTSAEYKFLLTAAMFLSPFAPIALEPVIERLQRKALPVFALITLVIVTPAVHKVYTDFPWTPPWGYPSVNGRSFELKLDETEPQYGLIEAIRQKTAPSTILVIKNSKIHYPTLTHRSLYAAPQQELPYPGIFLTSSHLLQVLKGYSKETFNGRRETVKDLFESPDDAVRARSLRQILELKRPAAIVLEIPRDTALQRWLADGGQNSRIFTDGSYEVWLVNSY